MLKSRNKRRKHLSPMVKVRATKWTEERRKLLEMFEQIESLQEDKKFSAAQILIDDAIRLVGPIYREVQALGNAEAQASWKKLYDKAWGYSVTNF